MLNIFEKRKLFTQLSNDCKRFGTMIKRRTWVRVDKGVPSEAYVNVSVCMFLLCDH